MSAVSAPPDDKGCSIAILDLPVGSSLTLDGHVLRLQRDDFVGIKGIPLLSNDGFHFVVARAAVPQQQQGGGGGAGTVPVGFVIMPATTTDHQTLALVRRYSALTEEVSSDEVDATTVSNLATRMEANQLEPHRMIAYSDIVKDESQAWNDATQFISRQLLTSRNIRHGLKIVPGCYSEDDDEQSTQQDDKDGSSILYPPIPVLQSASSAAARHSQHAGTKKYLATLTPTQRTALFVQQTNPATAILDSILHKYYHNRWQELLGDIQLSYLIFLQLQCLGSLEHWRDLVAMLCQVDVHPSHIIPLYTHFLTILSKQVLAIEQDFFEDMETTGDNFLLPSLRQLCQTTAHIRDENLQAARTQLCRILENRFQGVVSTTTTTTTYMEMDSDEEEDEEDKPVVVSTEEYEASMARASNTTPQQHGQKDQQPQNIRQQYPVLFAAQMDHEDILMTCARALDEKNDVSLVREAAAFLVEEVEPGATYTVS
ncbi:Protein AAR2 homolog [Seminavis robusta]|uniref:Protein AAR2 homolog n=1 Tax=Seminavis robusta TaxID=568900 RepID=A0A9N8HB16_9STRA|nr:Protein AAR2 homolog [Seminavis robusta]|eukprot:Sro319_g116160.1 Protein AAR2 homolog (485) ;mRNA; f:13275-14729